MFCIDGLLMKLNSICIKKNFSTISKVVHHLTLVCFLEEVGTRCLEQPFSCTFFSAFYLIVNCSSPMF